MTETPGDSAHRALTVSPATERLCPEVVATTWDAHSAELLALLVGVLRNREGALDVRQIVFTRLVESGHTADRETIKGWLFTVAIREALNYRRQAARLDRHLQSYAQDQDQSAMQATSEQQLVKLEDITRLKVLLRELPDDQLVVVQKRIYEGQSFAQIAEQLEIPLGTILTRMRLAMEKLKRWMGDKTK